MNEIRTQRNSRPEGIEMVRTDILEKKKKKEKKIVHQELYDASFDVKDESLRKIIREISTGVFRNKKIVLKDDSLVVRMRKEDIKSEPLTFNASCVDVIINFLEETGVYIQTEENDQDFSFCIENWSTCSLDIRTTLLLWFYDDMKKKYKLSEKEVDRLRNDLTIALYLKSVSSADIEVKDSRISKIQNFEFDKVERKWIFPQKSEKKARKTSGKKKSEKETSALLSGFEKDFFSLFVQKARKRRRTTYFTGKDRQTD